MEKKVEDYIDDAYDRAKDYELDDDDDVEIDDE